MPDGATDTLTTEPTAAKVTKAWKGLDKDFACRNHQFAIGETYEVEGPPVICKSGFHACLSPLDVLNYYPAATSRYAEVELIGEAVTHADDSKVCAARIHIVREISYFELWQAHRAWIADQELEAMATGDSGHAAATGYSGHAAATGDSGHAAATGDRGHAAATGDSGHAAATGDSGHAAATGYSGHAAATGYRGHAAATGYSGHAAATGDRGHAAATGDSGIAISIGVNGTALSGESGHIVLAEYKWNNDAQKYQVIDVKVGKVGRDIEANTTYTLKNGQFVKCEVPNGQ